MKVLLYRDMGWLLSDEAFSLYAPCMYYPIYEDFKAQMESFFVDFSVKIFVCDNQGEKTGVLVLKISGVSAEIIGIAVSEKSRCRGIGKFMIQFAMESEGLERIEAQTDDDSIEFYRKCGFVEERIVITYPDGEAVRYNCVLNK